MDHPATDRRARHEGAAAVTLSEQIEANKLTIAELEAVVSILDEVVSIGIPDDAPLSGALKAATAKMHWHIAASRNEVEYS